MEIVNNFLQEKGSLVWLFVLGPAIQETDILKVKSIYDRHIKYDYEVPLCQSYEETKKFLNL